MKDIIFDEFQDLVNSSLLKHKSIIDIMSKLQESNSRINRAVAKSVTSCGCIKINAEKQPNSLDEEDIANLSKHLKSHLHGTLCDNCREIIESEIGNNLFYINSLCNTLDISLYDTLIKEYNKLNTLGDYSFK
ncbi:DUF1573 domain-containing protein [Clostridium sp. 19966]|uniref:DUF1573 domain-containing protein n=1 Tax=Clostridium sp. 19966 TaxID=2768166 RepID=UPI0028DD6707|nr:DUF1573 domain-containing protein [Clostridium sp. 19966]MDT8715790.1 DUF1573 domain-containing protein [Clostridium sp. 19966]